MVFHGDFMVFHGDFIGISWYFMGISWGFHRDFMVFHGDFMVFHGDFIGISWETDGLTMSSIGIFIGSSWDFPGRSQDLCRSSGAAGKAHDGGEPAVGGGAGARENWGMGNCETDFFIANFDITRHSYNSYIS